MQIAKPTVFPQALRADKCDAPSVSLIWKKLDPVAIGVL
jgi:hypothetical protein